jgi:hypothetical protein
MSNSLKLAVLFLLVLAGCNSPVSEDNNKAPLLEIRHNEAEGEIKIIRQNDNEPVLTQVALPGTRPYIHPIIAPDGKGELTQFSPAHHKHQTGLYWGLKQVNGRDFFMNWKEDYWRRVSVNVLREKGQQVSWQTTYDLLDETGSTILTESQTWSFRESDGKYVLDLKWEGKAKTDVTMGKFYVGGLFLRMPWHEGVEGSVVNSAGHRNKEAEGQRAMWNDIGLLVPGRDNLAHIAILDHPDNEAFPTPWRVDNELGVGPSRQILGEWTIPEGEAETIRYRLIVYTGDFQEDFLTQAWKHYVCRADEPTE